MLEGRWKKREEQVEAVDKTAEDERTAGDQEEAERKRITRQ